MTDDRYLTIDRKSEGLYKEKGSKFLAYALPVQSESEIREILQQYRKTYYDARHVCYAYILGRERTTYNSSDAGEPAHTAGDPILNEIRSSGLTNILIIVVRYFGGTKLGKSGLITAYREAARDCLQHAIPVEKTETDILVIRFTYEKTNLIQSQLTKVDAEITSSSYTDLCEFHLAIPRSRMAEARELLNEFLV